MSNRKNKQPLTNQESEPTFDDKLRPWIPQGEYTALCSAARKYRDYRFKRDVIVLEFCIAEGEHAGKRLERYYRLTPRVTKASSYLREWVLAAGGIVPRRHGCLTRKKFIGKMFLVLVVTVEKSWDGRDWPSSLKYSKVGAILRLETTNEAIE